MNDPIEKSEDDEGFEDAPVPIKEENVTTLGYEADSEEEIPDDCFHMVTQYNWEEDIIWNGDDMKHKVQWKKTKPSRSLNCTSMFIN